MNHFNKLLGLLFFLSVFNDVSGQKAIGIPPEVDNWIGVELQRNSDPTPVHSYRNDDLFFSADSGTIVGYLSGYKGSEGFKTGMIYIENEFSRTDHPVVIKILADGHFQARVPMWYPKVVEIDFDHHVFQCYIEPGQALGLIINWREFRKTEKYEAVSFYGPLAAINRSRGSIPLPKTDAVWLADQVMNVKPRQFKESTLLEWDVQKNILDSILIAQKSDEKAKALAHAELNITMLLRLHNYAMDRAREKRADPSNIILQTELPEDFYDFIKRISTDDNSIFIPNNFNSFINCMEYGPLFKAANLADNELWMTGLEKVVKLDKIRDSIAHNQLYLRYGKLYDLIRFHRLNQAFHVDLRSADNEALVAYCNRVLNSCYNPFYRQQGQIIVNEGYRRKEGRGVSLPLSYAGGLFKELIAPYAGKMILVDFWSTTCALCMDDIERMRAMREQYKYSKDFVFLFITSKDESSKRAYQSFVQKQQLINTKYLNGDDYRYLTELFGVYGIPAYSIINKNGEILSRKCEPHEFIMEMRKLNDVKERFSNH